MTNDEAIKELVQAIFEDSDSKRGQAIARGLVALIMITQLKNETDN